MTLHEALLIGGMALITFAIRYTLFAAGHRVRFTPLMSRALGYVPVAVLTAIIAPMMLRPEGQLALQLDNAWLFGGLAAIAVAAWWRNLLLTICAGMACFLFWRWLF